MEAYVICVMPDQSLLQFSHGTTGGIADVPAQLADILKFGLEALLQSDERWVPRAALCP